MPTELVSLDGAIVGDQQHTSLGQVVRQGGTASTPWRFPGQYYDQETGLHYDNQRYYDPETGAYLSPHPLGLMAVPNPHTYAPNLLTINWIGSRLSSSHRLPLSAGVDGFDARLFSGGGRVAAESAASERLDWYTVEPPNPWE
jgi:RHS repeat-associated protein